jgi:thiol-disulfide isomerase/thioredoxin
MPNIVKIFIDALNPRKFYMWMCFLVLILIIGGYYVYKNNYLDMINIANKNIPNTGTTENIQILFFTVDWCPHCKNAQTPWNNFHANHNNKQIKNAHITCIKYDMSEKDQTDTDYRDYTIAKSMGEKYKVDGFPTIKMIKGDQVIDFDAKITSYSLEKFVENMI